MTTEKKPWGRPAQIDIPPYVPPTPEELAERQAAARDLLALRDEIGPIDMTWDELLRGDEPEEE